MPRTPRVQYENAIFHVMARGDRREPIVYGYDDRQLFLDTFAEACGRVIRVNRQILTNSRPNHGRFMPRAPRIEYESAVYHPPSLR